MKCDCRENTASDDALRRRGGNQNKNKPVLLLSNEANVNGGIHRLHVQKHLPNLSARGQLARVILACELKYVDDGDWELELP